MQNLEINSRFKAEQELHQDLASHLVADNPLLQEGAIDKIALENLFHSMMILGPSFEFYVLDALGKVKTYSAKPGLVLRQEVNLEPIKQMVNENFHYPLYGDDPRNLDGEKIFSVAPLIKNNQLQGYLYVIIGGQIYDSVFERISTNQNLQLSLIVAGATLLFLLASLLITFKIFVSPLRRLTNEVNVIREKGFEKKLVELTHSEFYAGEVKDLGLAFNEMIDQINHQMGQLQDVDSQRRELLSHISHDLRTPLASLQGYLETIELKGSVLSEEQQKAFLKRSLKNAQLLKQLVDQIFELAHLESGQVAIQLEQFSLAELLYDLRDKFSVMAKTKNISIEIDCPESSLLIKTDIGKLERILSNLIENSLRHTSKDGVIILGVSAVDNGQGWIVSVEDNGEGISESDVPFIFDAHFRAENATPGKNRNMGLGLAITRKLLQVLGSEIRVKSSLGVGTRFSFSLE